MTGIPTHILAHSDLVITTVDPGSYVGSPLYRVVPEHELALAGLLLIVMASWWVRRRQPRHIQCGESCASHRYGTLEMRERFIFWLVTSTSVIHAGLVLGHEPSGYSIAYGIGAIATGWIAWRILGDRPWHRHAKYILTGSILAYAATLFGGEAPDQLGILTKLIEITAIAAILLPIRADLPIAGKSGISEVGRFQQTMRSGAVVALLIITATAAWTGAMSSGEGGHHLGETPQPGFLLPGGEDRAPTAAEQSRADHLHEEVVHALAKFGDPSVAAAHGYDVEGMFGTDFHATNESLKHDGRILDPHYPETLVYAMAGDRPVLLGAMFEMDEIGQSGPAIGGPLTVWHAHDHICMSLAPIGIAGLQGPFGSCPAGSINIPITNEMFHVWVLPGLEDPFGDIDEASLNQYLDAASD